MHIKLTAEEQETLATYDREAQEWSITHDRIEFWQQEVAELQELLPSGSLIEIGAGGGRDARLLIAAGYDYLGTDISQPMLDEAKSRNPEAKYEQKSIYELDYPAETFDGFWMSNTLHHVPKRRVPKALRSLHRILKPGAIGFLSVKEGTGEKMTDQVAEAATEGSYRRFFSFFRKQELQELLEENGFDIVQSNLYRPGTHVVMNKKTTWLTMFVRRI